MKSVRHSLLMLLFCYPLIICVCRAGNTTPAFAATTTPNRLEIARTPGLNNNGELFS